VAGARNCHSHNASASVLDGVWSAGLNVKEGCLIPQPMISSKSKHFHHSAAQISGLIIQSRHEQSKLSRSQARGEDAKTKSCIRPSNC